ncbi:ABC transporter permease [Paenibacillus sp. MMS18-CY102]|uniref:ABC transporter permease n=1 Tax=Paenibacillus sp. MMS18-CY102 TaxID=2682849 RepID=UPI0013656057|nr:ABC transporter permease [Paenibacillus sp. MMS18-CY102]MWC30361.1 ABC transporter permease [Paenibacillus sp. MMS18-CY102]
MSNFWTVVGFTIRNKVRTKAFLISSIIIAIILSVVVNLPYLISQFSSNTPDKVGYIGSTQQEASSSISTIGEQLETYFKKQDEPDYEFVKVNNQGSPEANEKALVDKLAAGELDAYVTFNQEDQPSGFPQMIIKSENEYNTSEASTLQTALQAIKMEFSVQGLGLDDIQKRALFAPAIVDSVKINVGEDGGSTVEEAEERPASMYGVVYIILFLLFMSIMTTGQLIATEITAEKSSRVMEVLITSVSPLKQMFGKILGIFLVGLSQILFYVAVIAVNLSLPYNENPLNDLGIHMSDIPVSLYIYALLFYLIGFFLYATLYAGVGSLVSRTEELGQAVMPLMFTSLGGFYIGIFGLNAPDSMLIKVASFIPFFTPYIMFLRVGMVDPPTWQVVLSLIILVITTGAAGWLSAKIYRTGVLMYGKRPTLKELRKAMKAYKF